MPFQDGLGPKKRKVSKNTIVCTTSYPFIMNEIEIWKNATFSNTFGRIIIA